MFGTELHLSLESITRYRALFDIINGMIRKAIIVGMTLAALSVTVLWFNLIEAATFYNFPDRHYMGFAMIHDRFNQSLRILSYRSYPSVAIPIQWKSSPLYNLLIIPLWSLLVVFWCYPIKVFILRARRRRYVERRWFAVTAGMSAFAFAVFEIFYLHIFEVRLDRVFGSGTAALVVELVILVSVPPICAILVHNVIVGPLRRASLRKPRMCVGCDYNLTGNESGVCPECGTKMDESQ